MRIRSTSKADDEQIPRLREGVDPTVLRLTPAEGYLLSRVDGRTPWGLLRELGGLAPHEVDASLESWLKEEILVLGAGGREVQVEDRARQSRVTEAQAAPGAAPPSQPPPSGPRPAMSAPATDKSREPSTEPSASAEMVAADHADIDPGLEIQVDAQRRVLAFSDRLELSYYEILGVARDADNKQLKKAYFRLSKEFHPDRYFRREIGPYVAHLDRVFKKIVEAYELLSDPTARAEIERSLAVAPTPPSAEEGTTPAASPAQRVSRPRTRHVFSLHNRLLKPRRAKAKRLFEAGMAAFNEERWVEAAASVRLAIAFDPWNSAYKEEFATVQRQANEEHATRLVREAESALELRDYEVALRAFEDALHYRPHDADLLFRAARISWLTKKDLHRAKEWAQAAVELEPEEGAYRRLLGQVYKLAGLEANARRELETAVRLDPTDEEARAELGAFRSLLKPGRWLGGK